MSSPQIGDSLDGQYHVVPNTAPFGITPDQLNSIKWNNPQLVYDLTTAQTNLIKSCDGSLSSIHTRSAGGQAIPPSSQPLSAPHLTAAAPPSPKAAPPNPFLAPDAPKEYN